MPACYNMEKYTGNVNNPVERVKSMKAYAQRTKEELLEELGRVEKEYQALKELGLNLNIARGKPGSEQLDLVRPMMDVLNAESDYICDGIDVRNYGNLEGLPACRRLFAELLGVKPENVLVGGNASLLLMYQVINAAYIHGLRANAWCKCEKVRWLCPAPGYDRHFKITESFGFELVTVPMTPEGPEMDLVEELIKDPAVKGMWCVPKYSNPDGVIYSDDTIRRIAAMKPAAEDFLLMWDNAYCVHEFAVGYQPFPSILAECEKKGNGDMVFEFASTSKITFPGAGVSCFACSEENLRRMIKELTVQIISYDKVNQLRHVRYLKDKEGVLSLMRQHAQVLAPKFSCVLEMLEREIAPLGIAQWEKPVGGYFISVNVLPGTAMATWELCRDAGLTLTKAGASFPYGKDPQDSNIRVAPSLPPVEQLEQAMQIFCCSMKLAALRKLVCSFES